MTRTQFISTVVTLLCVATPAAAQSVLPTNHFTVSFSEPPPEDVQTSTPIHLSLTPPAGNLLQTVSVPVNDRTAFADRAQGSARQLAFEYSDGYRLRAKIHRYASLATLPLFGAEAIVGQSLYKNPSDGKKSLHLAIATGMGTLFAVNSVTGVWNLVEARKDPHGRTRRWVHGILLLAADAGFLAAALSAPEEEEGAIRNATQFSQARSRHRTLAFTSIGLTTIGYLVMLVGR